MYVRLQRYALCLPLFDISLRLVLTAGGFVEGGLICPFLTGDFD
jgi:hypothetical protein